MADAPVLGGSEKVTLDDAVFGARFNGPLVHESVRAELAARRQGTHATKTRGNVRGGIDGASEGESITVEIFEPGDKIKVAGIGIGKGFQGTIKRHNFSRGPKSHGSHNVRAPGSIGASAWPARVMKGIRGPGHMGAKRVTQKGLTIVELIPDQNLMLLRGSVPGPKGATVEVRTDA